MVVVEVLIGVVAAALLVTAALSVKIVREYQRIVLFRLGRASGVKGPGSDLHQSGHRQDLGGSTCVSDSSRSPNRRPSRRTTLPSPSTSSSSRTRSSTPRCRSCKVQNFVVAAQNVAVTTLRSVARKTWTLDDVLSKREDMNASLRVRLDEVTERRGVKVTTVEVREVNPPAGVLEAMTRQMSAERTWRASDYRGLRVRSRRRSPWPRVPRQAAVLGAEGERQSAILRAEGLAAAVEKTWVVGRGVDKKTTLELQYLQTLKAGRDLTVDQDRGADGAGRVGERDSGPTALAGIERTREL